MPKYTQEIKDKAVQLAVAGTPLKEIQRTLGPNPKAVQRYLKKSGIDYTKIVEKNKAAKAAAAPKTDAKVSKKPSKSVSFD